jgi:hypothetical protein
MPGLRGHPGGNYDHVGVGGVGIILGPDHVGIAFFDGHGFKQVEPFPCGTPFHDVNQDYVCQFFGGHPVGRSGAHIARTDDGNFVAHGDNPFISLGR